jgi:succinyl-CoA synthetase beta subunit
LKLPEVRAKEIFRQVGIPIPKGQIATTPSEAKDVARELGKPVALKAQVLSGSRGKAGGILFAEDFGEAEKKARKLLGSEIGGVKVTAILVEERLRISKELYLGVAIDRSLRAPAVITSPVGGSDIEETAERFPNKIHKVTVNPIHGLQDYHARYLIRKIGLPDEQYSNVVGVLTRLYHVFSTFDAELTEINPLAISDNGAVVAVDARLNVDDASLFRHPEFKTRADFWELRPLERKARQAGVSYVELDGNIGIIGNGAGLVMATLDVVNLFGGIPANFCDVGGGANAEIVGKAIELVLSNPKINVLLINILGGITRCDEIASGLVEAKRKGATVPAVVRLVGTNEEEGRRICEAAGFTVLDEMDAAVKMAVRLSTESP